MYEETQQGPVLLFIHDLGSSTRDWEKQLADFCGRFRVIMFDVRGHGMPDKPLGTYSKFVFSIA